MLKKVVPEKRRFNFYNQFEFFIKLITSPTTLYLIIQFLIWWFPVVFLTQSIKKRIKKSFVNKNVQSLAINL